MHPKTKEAVVRKPDPNEPLAALAFKTVADPTGDLVYIRVYSGQLLPGETYLNTTINRTERIARFFRMMGDKRLEQESAGPGDIVAAIGLKQTFTGQTLCDQDAPVALESITFPKPVINASLAAAKTIDSGKLGEALGRLVRDDPTLRTHTDEETKELILSGMGELHLEVSAEKLRRALNIPQSDPSIQLGRPRVAYRQTFARSRDIETVLKKQTGGRGKYAVINVKYRPLTPDDIEEKVKEIEELKDPKVKPDPNGVYFVNAISQGTIPKEYIPSVEEGFRDGCKKGQKYPFPFVDVEAELHFGKFHDVDSSQDAFYMCAADGFRDAQEQCGIQLLEPIMKVVAVCPKQYQGSISGDINRRRGIIEETSEDKGVAQVMAKIPLSELFGYTSDLRSATAARRASRWSSATTPRSARSWPTCRRRTPVRSNASRGVGPRDLQHTGPGTERWPGPARCGSLVRLASTRRRAAHVPSINTSPHPGSDVCPRHRSGRGPARRRQDEAAPGR